MSWIYIDYIDKLEDCDFCHCDTRDFHISTYYDAWNKSKVLSQLSTQYKESQLKDLLIRQDEILGALKAIEMNSGGKGEWRFIPFKRMWYKYIRFVRYGDVEMYGKKIPTFLIYRESGGQSHIVTRNELKELSECEFDKDTLNFIKEEDFRI